MDRKSEKFKASTLDQIMKNDLIYVDFIFSDFLDLNEEFFNKWYYNYINEACF